MNFNHQVFDELYKTLKHRITPMSVDQCSALADLLADLVIKHDDKILIENRGTAEDLSKEDQMKMFGAIAAPRCGDYYLWEVKNIKVMTGKNSGASYFIWIPDLFGKKSLMAFKDGSYMFIHDWDKENVRVYEKEGKQYFCFTWKPELMEAKPEVLDFYKQLKKISNWYLSIKV